MHVKMVMCESRLGPIVMVDAGQANNRSARPGSPWMSESLMSTFTSILCWVRSLSSIRQYTMKLCLPSGAIVFGKPTKKI